VHQYAVSMADYLVVSEFIGFYAVVAGNSQMKVIAKKILDLYRRSIRALRIIKAKRQCASYKGKITVGGPTLLTKNTHLGNNANFNGLIINGGGRITIGDNFHSGPGCLFISQNHNFDGGAAIPYDNTYIYKEIVIGDNVWLGSRVIVLGGVTIGEGSIIQAGSCVVSDIPPYAIAGGHPARVFGQRNIQHYERLKSEEKFF
jgi:acetyltransferase-like isoleucine patch superfamily enzyme